jgi:hypothetical protein
MDPEDTEVDDILPVMMGGLSSADALSSDQRQRGLVEAQMRSNMAALTKARDDLRAQRAGPGSAERLLAIAAALGQPTRTGSFGETLGNVGAVLGSQEKTKREAAAQNAALAEKYGMQIGNEQLRLLMQGLTGTGQMLRSAQAADVTKAKAARPIFRGTETLANGQIVAVYEDPLTGNLDKKAVGEGMQQMVPVASATRCEEMRLSSIIITRMTLARSGI